MLAVRLPRILQAKQNLLRGSSLARDVRKGYIAVYVGEEEKKRIVIPLSYLNQSSFQELLSKAEEEFGFDHPMGGLTIPCREDIFLDLTSEEEFGFDHPMGGLTIPCREDIFLDLTSRLDAS